MLCISHSQEADFLASTWGAKTVGPNMPSVNLDHHLPGDDDDNVSYGVHLYTPMAAECKAWLDAHPAVSVVYVSFGSIASLGARQMEEVAEGLCRSGMPFLWVVSATETRKLPKNFAGGEGARRAVVPAAGGSRAPLGWVLRDARRVELDLGGDQLRRAHSGDAALVGPADERQVRPGRVARRRAGTAGFRWGGHEEGGGEVCAASDGRGKVRGVQAESFGVE